MGSSCVPRPAGRTLSRGSGVRGSSSVTSLGGQLGCALWLVAPSARAKLPWRGSVEWLRATAWPWASVPHPPPLKSTIWATAEDKQLPPTASAARQARACRVACCQRGHAGVDHVHTPCRHSAVDGTPRQPSRGRSAPPLSAHPWRLYLAPPAVPPERAHAGPRWPIKSSGTDCLQLACQLRDERAPVCEIVRNCSQKTTSLTEVSCQTSREIGKQATIRCDG